jgi:hypothetical protein
MQVSAVTTLAAGLMSSDSNSPGPSYAGIGVGAGWLVVSTLMAAFYHPYASADRDISPMPKGSMREQLTRERAAEEEIKRIAATGQRLKWMSVLTNLGAGVYLIAKGKNKDALGETNYVTQGFQVASAVFSLAPLFFGFHWESVYEEQKDYKKRIYAPVATPTIFVDPVTQKYTPGFALSMQF